LLAVHLDIKNVGDVDMIKLFSGLFFLVALLGTVALALIADGVGFALSLGLLIITGVIGTGILALYFDEGETK